MQTELSTFDRLRCKVFNGAFAGVVGVTCTFPLDLVKTRMQSQNKSGGGPPKYRNAVHCFQSVVRGEGFRGLYRGVGVNLLLINPEKAIKLVVNDELRRNFAKRSGKQKISVLHEVLAGAGAGSCQIVITTPMELLKIQMQLASQIPGNKMTALQLAKQLYSEKGLRGLYKGTLVTALRDVSFSCVYFPLVGIGCSYFASEGEDKFTSFMKTLAIASFAGASASGLVTPFDVVKTRIQTIAPGVNAVKYNGVPDTFAKVIKNEGFGALYKGCVPRMSVIAPLMAIAQSVYFIGVAEMLFGVNEKKY
eukprot:sb/3467214/